MDGRKGVACERIFRSNYCVNLYHELTFTVHSYSLVLYYECL